MQSASVSLVALTLALALSCPPTAANTAGVTRPPTAAADLPVAQSRYDKPPANVLQVLHAPSPPFPYVSPSGGKILLASWEEYPPMARVAEPFLRLAGVRVEPRTRRRHDTNGGYGINACAREFTVVAVATSAEVHVALPPGCAEGPVWSTDGTRFAFRNTAGDSVQLCIADAATGAVRVLPGIHLNPMLGYTVQWMPDQKALLVKLIPDDTAAPPVARQAPFAPNIQETNGEKGESSTYETRDTLTSPHDESLFDFYASSQLALVDADTAGVVRIGKPGIFTSVQPAPDGEHLLVQSIRRPYSYVTTFDRFPHAVEVWDRAGRLTHGLASLPLHDRVPVHGVPTGPRAFMWHPLEPATLIWAEALDGGDWKARVPARDKVMVQKAPFDAAATELARTEQRYEGLSVVDHSTHALLREYDDNRHWTRTFDLDLGDRNRPPVVLWDHSSDEHYKDPGAPVLRELRNGFRVVRHEGDAIFLRAQGSSPDGDRPFLDRFDLKTHKSTRLFRSDKTAYETFLSFGGHGDRSALTFLTWHQSPSEAPNAFLRTLGPAIPDAPAEEAAMASVAHAVTHLADPTPAVRAIKKRLIRYKRQDGLELSFTLYTPPGYQEGQRVPAVLYAYPRDYADPTRAGQITGSEQLFTSLRTYRLLLLSGYAIIDNASFPIVGDPQKAYDTYLEQLVLDARAAVDKAVELGVVDPQRIGITGHSHGALMTVNLLAHSDLFRAGVATSGSYNKTLTPFGFQNERRSVWEAKDVYWKASPFFFADKLSLPLLIMHGEDDANPGTTPLQATKLYEAIRGNGGTARLVMLPHEPHWYAALESNEQLAAEMLRWFDKYVKNATPRSAR